MSVLRVLEAFGADLERPSASGAAPVHVAAENDNSEALMALASTGADLALPHAGSGATPAWLAAAAGHVDTLAAMHALNPILLRPKTRSGQSVAVAACLNGHGPVVAFLARAGALWPDDDDDDEAPGGSCGVGWAPLLAAAYSGHLDVATVLVDALSLEPRSRAAAACRPTTRALAADVPRGSTPLKVALAKGHAEVAALLRDRLTGLEEAEEGGASNSEEPRPEYPRPSLFSVSPMMAPGPKQEETDIPREKAVDAKSPLKLEIEIEVAGEV